MTSKGTRRSPARAIKIYFQIAVLVVLPVGNSGLLGTIAGEEVLKMRMKPRLMVCGVLATAVCQV